MVLCNILLAFAAAFGAAYASAITAAAELKPRQNSYTDPALIGWVTIPDLRGFSASTCESGAVWSTVGLYGVCCSPGGSCSIPTACVGTTVQAYGSSSWTCGTLSGTRLTCFTDYIVDRLSGTETTSWIGCDYPREPSIFYRTSPPTVITTTPGSSPTDPPPPSSGKKSNTGVIVGAAVGGVGALIITVVLIWWILRHHKKKSAEQTHMGAAQYYGEQEPPEMVVKPPMSPSSPPPTYPSSPVFSEPKVATMTAVHGVPDSRQPSFYAPPVVNAPVELYSGQR